MAASLRSSPGRRDTRHWASMSPGAARWRRWWHATLDRFGRIDILVNNAGINIRGPDRATDRGRLGPSDRHEPERPLALLPRRGRADEAAEMGTGDQRLEYAGRDLDARPHAVRIEQGGPDPAHQTLALEWAGDGINVNALCPGPFATEINTPLLNDPAVSAQMQANVPLGRWGEPAELGPAAVFLASEASSFMTGRHAVHRRRLHGTLERFTHGFARRQRCPLILTRTSARIPLATPEFHWRSLASSVGMGNASEIALRTANPHVPRYP